MNKNTKTMIVFLFFIICLGIFIVSTHFAVIICSKWIGLLIGMAFMLLAIPMHILAKERPFLYVFSILSNSIGSGFSVSAYYLTKGISLNIFTMIYVSILAVVILGIVFLLLCRFTKKITFITAAIINILLLIITLIYWIKTGELFFSFGFFSLLMVSLFIYVFFVTIDKIDQNVLRAISFGSFGAYIVLTIIVIAILTEGDILDLGFGGDGKNRKRMKR